MNEIKEWQWNIKKLTNNYKSHVLTTETPNVSVAIIDSGIDYNHPDLKDKILYSGKSFLENDNSIIDTTGHGTLVAGIITASGLSNGISNNIKIASYKVLDIKGGNSHNIIKAIKQAIIDKHKVINISAGTYLSPNKKNDKLVINQYKSVVQLALKNNVIIVASTGNKYSSNKKDRNMIYFPSSLDGVISVGALDRNNNICDYSPNGNLVDLFAPGGSFGPLYHKEGIVDYRCLILSTFPTYLKPSLAPRNIIPSGYEFSLGTSLATAEVSATITLIMDKYFKVTGKYPSKEEILNIIKKKHKNYYILDTYESLNYLSSMD